MKLHNFLYITICAAFLSCEKDDGSGPSVDSEAPGITIEAPLEGTSYHVGDTMPIQIFVTENDQLHEIDVTLRDLSDSSRVFLLHRHQHGLQYTVDTSFVLTADAGEKDFAVEVIASDHSGNVATKSITKYIEM